MEKLGLNFKLDEQGKPIACLFRTKEGYWVWHKVGEMDEEETIELIENEKQNITKRQST